MPANSFQNAQCPDGKYAVPAGELHLLDEGDRNSGWDISVNPTTSWVEHNVLSGRVPKGTKALFGWGYFVRTDPAGVLEIRDAISAETNALKVKFSRITSLEWGGPVIIKATDGIFDIQEQDATLEISNFIFHLWGYYL